MGSAHIFFVGQDDSYPGSFRRVKAAGDQRCKVLFLGGGRELLSDAFTRKKGTGAAQQSAVNPLNMGS